MLQMFGKDFLSVSRTSARSESTCQSLLQLGSGLRKKALRKLECLALRNEIDVTNAWLYLKLVSRTKARIYSNAVTDFILGKHFNF